ncbi:MAG TPA: DUF935 family protein [Steroidobacteraceae bacterium]
MSLFDRARAWFQSTPEKRPANVEALAAQGSTAWSEEALFVALQRKYNPDDLVGRKGHKIYARMMRDEQVKAVVQFRRSAVTGRDWYFELDHERHGLAKEEAQRRIDIYTDMLHFGYRGAFVDGLNAVMRALWQGYSFTEIMFGTFESDGKTYWGVQELRPKPYESFIPEVNEFGDVLRWYQVHPGTGQEQTIDLAKFVYFVYNRDIDEHFGQSELRSAHRAWFAKDFTITFANIFAERLAGGFVVAAPRDGQGGVPAGSPEHNALKAILKNISASTSMLLPAGYQVEVHYAPAGQVEVFTKLIEFHDLAIAKSLLVPNLLGISSPKAQTGSYSQSETHFDVFMVVSDDDADRLADALNEQVFAPLGRVNFEDGIAPRLCFKPLSEAKKMALIDTWQKLVGAKAVEPSDTDESHVRDLLDFPAKGEPLIAPAPAGTAIAPGGNDSPGAGDQRPGSAPGRQPPEEARESLEGKLLRAYSSEAFARAERRVAFNVIHRQMEREHGRYLARVEDAMAELVADGLTRIAEDGLGSNPDSADKVGRFDLSGMKAQIVNTQVRRALQAAMTIGEDHARRELDTARGERFSRRLDGQRLGDMAAEWLKQKSFTITGDLRAGALKEIKQVLLNALKFSWTQTEIKRNVYKALVTKGYLAGTTAMAALGLGDLQALAEQLDIQGGLAPHRLDTVIRTNMFEAMNEARFNAFTDPGLEGFVIGFQYSAILDSRTTEVCRHMDGRTYPATDWEGPLRQWAPPNHFNCRSLLIPITAVDEDVEMTEERPRVAPQEGFGG